MLLPPKSLNQYYNKINFKNDIKYQYMTSCQQEVKELKQKSIGMKFDDSAAFEV